jgi:hypothetical protein
MKMAAQHASAVECSDTLSPINIRKRPAFIGLRQ